MASTFEILNFGKNEYTGNPGDLARGLSKDDSVRGETIGHS